MWFEKHILITKLCDAYRERIEASNFGARIFVNKEKIEADLDGKDDEEVTWNDILSRSLVSYRYPGKKFPRWAGEMLFHLVAAVHERETPFSGNAS